MRLLLVMCLAGCMVSERYIIPVAATGPLIPATRVKRPAQVQIYADTIDRSSMKPQADPSLVEVRAGRKSPKLLAGHLLTWIGTAISLTGNALFIAYYGQNNAEYYSGIGLTASAEPLMIVGTILWILALREHPAENR